MSNPTRPQSAPYQEAMILGRWFTSVRREGFLATLPAEAWHTLSAVLSFTSRDGSRPFTLDQLALALGLSRREASVRLDRLAETTWRGIPIVSPELSPKGEVCGARVAAIEQLGASWPEHANSTETSPQGSPETDTLPASLIDALAQVGLNHTQIDSLARRFPEDEIRQQLDWLPARKARNPAALLIRAIEQDWDEPKERR